MRLTAEALNYLLQNVEKPARYIGNEVGSVIKNEATIRWALCFPDIYEAGESYLGLKILYSTINNHEGWAAERVYAPWPDLVKCMEENHQELWTLETLTPIKECDIVAFSLPHEMCYTTVLRMLQLGNIPLNPAERGEDMPIIMAGGLQAYNAEPLAPFIDVFLLGDGEELNVEVTALLEKGKNEGLSRDKRIASLAAIPGVYLPQKQIPLYDGLYVSGWQDENGKKIAVPRLKARRLNDLSKAALPSNIIPWARPVHDRVTVEIQRGCDHGCRFCSAGMLYRPVRHRSAAEVLERAKIGVRKTGQEEVGLLSLTAADHPEIEEIITNLIDWGKEQGIAVSLPSLRLESLRPKVANAIASSGRRTGFTIAPEAATERMRNVINKGNTEEELLKAVSNAINAGWQRIKFYFMLGLPTETDEDILAIADLCRKVLRSTRKRLNIEVSCAAFIPKAHTPFQFAAQVTGDELDRRFRLLKEAIKPMREVRLSYSSNKQAQLEGLFSRGDRRQGTLLLAAIAGGAYLDNWTENFKWQVWEDVLANSWDSSSPSLDEYLGVRLTDKELPWNHILSTVPAGFMVREWEKALRAEPSIGGVCAKRQQEMAARDLAEETAEATAAQPDEELELKDGEPVAYPVRLRYAKRGRAPLLGHLEVTTQLIQAMRRAGLPMTMSGGHHPAPRVGFGPALSLGQYSEAELVDIGLREMVPTAEIIEKLKAELPADIVPLQAWPLEITDAPACEAVVAVRYQLTVRKGVDLTILANRIAEIIAHKTFGVKICRKGKYRIIDARLFIKSLKLLDNQIVYTMNSFRDSGLRMGEFLAIIGLANRDIAKICKTDIAISSLGRAVAVPVPENLSVEMDLSEVQSE